MKYIPSFTITRDTPLCSKYLSLDKLRELYNGPAEWAYTYTLRGLLKKILCTKVQDFNIKIVLHLLIFKKSYITRLLSISKIRAFPRACYTERYIYDAIGWLYIQWNLGIRDTQGTVINCPEFWGGLISQVQFYVLNRPMDWSSCP